MEQSEFSEMKRCIRCGSVKPTDEFFLLAPSQRRHANHRRGHCKDCHNLHRSDWKHPQWYVRALSVRGRHDITNSVRPSLLRDVITAPSACYLCGRPVTWDNGEIDHIVPVARGGRGEPANLAWAHKPCNRLKGSFLLSEFVPLMRQILTHLED